MSQSDLEIRIGADIGNLRAELQRLRDDMGRLGQAGQQGGRSASAGMDSLGRSLSSLKSTIAGSLAGLVSITSAMQALSKTIEVQREFDKLNAGLITATGNSENAALAFQELQKFAAATPYTLQQSVEGFTKLVNLGLTPSKRALKAYGDTAAAMGKDLMQMIEAVADASTGEFERLKEFGIKAKQQGDKVVFTFQGVKTEVGNNAAEIEQYLIKLGENKFGDAMANRMATLDGAISNLGDSWDALWRSVSKAGVGDVIVVGVSKANDAISHLTKVLDSGEINALLSGIGKSFNLLGTDAKSDIDSIADSMDGLQEHLKESWRGTIKELNSIGNWFNDTRADIQKWSATTAAAREAIRNPGGNAREILQQQLADIEAERQNRHDAVIKGDDERQRRADIRNSRDKFSESPLVKNMQKYIDEHVGDSLEKYKAKGDDSSGNGSSKAADAVKKAAETLEKLVDGLKVKSRESTAGGSVKLGAAMLANDVQDLLGKDLKYFSSLNDQYHKGTKSNHAQGRGFDVVLNSPAASKAVTEQVRDILTAAGIDAKQVEIINEYLNPSKRATGGHIHVAFRTDAAAQAYAARAQGLIKAQEDQWQASQSAADKAAAEAKRKTEDDAKDLEKLIEDALTPEQLIVKRFELTVNEINRLTKVGTELHTHLTDHAIAERDRDLKDLHDKESKAQEELKQSALKKQADAIMAKASAISANVQDREYALQRAGESDWRTRLTLKNAQNQVRNQGAAGLSEQRDLLLQLQGQGATGLDETIARLNREIRDLSATLPTATEQLNVFIADLAETGVKSAQGGLSQFFMDMVDGSKSAGEALRDFARSFALSMAQVAAKALATMLVLKALDFISPGLGRTAGAMLGVGVHHAGGIAGSSVARRWVNPALFGAAPRYHVGGIAGLQPGEVPAILQAGEEVLTRNDPRHVANGGGASSVRIVNQFTEDGVLNHMQSSNGEQVILNIIGRNAGSIRHLLG